MTTAITLHPDGAMSPLVSAPLCEEVGWFVTRGVYWGEEGEEHHFIFRAALSGTDLNRWMAPLELFGLSTAGPLPPLYDEIVLTGFSDGRQVDLAPSIPIALAECWFQEATGPNLDAFYDEFEYRQVERSSGKRSLVKNLAPHKPRKACRPK